MQGTFPKNHKKTSKNQERNNKSAQANYHPAYTSRNDACAKTGWKQLHTNSFSNLQMYSIRKLSAHFPYSTFAQFACLTLEINSSFQRKRFFKLLRWSYSDLLHLPIFCPSGCSTFKCFLLKNSFLRQEKIQSQCMFRQFDVKFHSTRRFICTLKEFLKEK